MSFQCWRDLKEEPEKPGLLGKLGNYLDSVICYPPKKAVILLSSYFTAYKAQCCLLGCSLQKASINAAIITGITSRRIIDLITKGISVKLLYGLLSHKDYITKPRISSSNQVMEENLPVCSESQCCVRIFHVMLHEGLD